VPKKVVIFGGSFNPPHLTHRKIAEILAQSFDCVKIVPCGPRPDKPATNDLAPIHRAIMADLTFNNIAPNVSIELFDLEKATFTRNYELEKIFSGEGEVWHVVDTAFIRGGGNSQSQIQQDWTEGRYLWKNSRFVVVVRDEGVLNMADLPPRHRIMRPSASFASSSVRLLAFQRQSLKGYVTPEVEEYIEQHNLYRGHGAGHYSTLSFKDPRPLIVTDEKNEKALRLRDDLAAHFTSPGAPNLIITIGGDGTMLRAIRTHWRKRIPFFGINAGHVGFLLNDTAENFSAETFREELSISHSPLLFVETEGFDGNRQESFAFNEAWLQVRQGKTGWFTVKINGEVRFPKMISDGIIVSTAAGSTAYAKAAGASQVPINTEVLIVVGSNVAFPSNWKNGELLPLDSQIEFDNCDESGWRETYGFVDNHKLGATKKMRVRASRIAAADLLFNKEYDIRKKLARTQFPKE